MEKSNCVLCNKKTESNQFCSMIADSFFVSYILERISRPFIDLESFKLGLINEDGNIIKKPLTIEEKMALSETDRFLIKLKKVLGNKIDIIKNSTLLEKSSENATIVPERYEKEIKLKSDLNVMAKHFYERINNANSDGIDTNFISKSVIESFCANENN